MMDGWKVAESLFAPIPAVCAEAILRLANGVDHVVEMLVLQGREAHFLADFLHHLRIAFGCMVRVRRDGLVRLGAVFEAVDGASRDQFKGRGPAGGPPGPAPFPKIEFGLCTAVASLRRS